MRKLRRIIGVVVAVALAAPLIALLALLGLVWSLMVAAALSRKADA